MAIFTKIILRVSSPKWLYFWCDCIIHRKISLHVW